VAHADGDGVAVLDKQKRRAQTSGDCDLKVMPIAGSPADDSVLPLRSPAEAREQLIAAIRHLWPFLDDAGRVEVTEFFHELSELRMRRH
jgi:hypothetical protein